MRSDNPKNNKNVMESLKNNKNVATPMWRHAPNDYEYTNKLRGVASHKLFG